ncbi:L,D-transpeptidase family protein [Maricaulis maris]|jgi:L,D-transpeptidase YcbB|uniref:L,D-transpeptidase family protein n=1 Tax=Maricaulis maris TaxID=74318 RepID=UPI00292270F8|nr:peptidoglycan-binding protein [Maricaulis maris]
MRRILVSTAFAALAVATMPIASATILADCRACETAERFYAGREGQPAWTGPVNAPLFEALREAVRGAAAHGLDPADYHLAALEAIDPRMADQQADELATDAYLTLAAHLLSGRLDPVAIEPDWTAARRGRDLAAYLQGALSSGAIEESLEALAPAQPGYAALQGALAHYRELAEAGGWPQIDAGPTLRPGERGPRIAQLRARLVATGDVAPAEEGQDIEVYDDALEAAVRLFQRRASLDSDGVVGARSLIQLNLTAADRVDQLEANLERWRWLPEDMGRRHIRVNIADFSLEARADGVVERRHDVIVGRLFRRTPVFTGSMSYLVVNPWWETPPSLAVRDKLPAFRADPSAVERLGFQVIDRSGAIVDPATINWAETPASGFPYRLRQAPGPLNALGEIKFMFPNPHNVYLHDTPTRGLFAQTRRDFSSGCVRVADPLALAQWVLQETPDWTPARLSQVAATDNETRVQLARSVPVHILYFTAVPDETTGVRFVDDIYERDGNLIAAMEMAPPPLE